MSIELIGTIGATHPCSYGSCPRLGAEVMRHQMHAPEGGAYACPIHRAQVLWDLDRCGVQGCEMRAARAGRCAAHGAPGWGLPTPERLTVPVPVGPIALPPSPPRPAASDPCAGPGCDALARAGGLYCCDPCRNRAARVRMGRMDMATWRTPRVTALRERIVAWLAANGAASLSALAHGLGLATVGQARPHLRALERAGRVFRAGKNHTTRWAVAA